MEALLEAPAVRGVAVATDIGFLNYGPLRCLLL